jgi:hypothetical protein
MSNDVTNAIQSLNKSRKILKLGEPLDLVFEVAARYVSKRDENVSAHNQCEGNTFKKAAKAACVSLRTCLPGDDASYADITESGIISLLNQHGNVTYKAYVYVTLNGEVVGGELSAQQLTSRPWVPKATAHETACAALMNNYFRAAANNAMGTRHQHEQDALKKVHPTEIDYVSAASLLGPLKIEFLENATEVKQYLSKLFQHDELVIGLDTEGTGSKNRPGARYMQLCTVIQPETVPHAVIFELGTNQDLKQVLREFVTGQSECKHQVVVCDVSQESKQLSKYIAGTAEPDEALQHLIKSFMKDIQPPGKTNLAQILSEALGVTGVKKHVSRGEEWEQNFYKGFDTEPPLQHHLLHYAAIDAYVTRWIYNYNATNQPSDNSLRSNSRRVPSSSSSSSSSSPSSPTQDASHNNTSGAKRPKLSCTQTD